jgi:hypothetical protein
MATALLEDLARRISQHESELQALRRELETQRQQFTNLTERREDLLSQLREVDQEIAVLAKGGKPRQQPARQHPATSKANAPKVPPRQVVISGKVSPKVGKPQPKPKQSLSSLLLAILGEAQGPMTVRELAAEAKRRGYRTKSKDFIRNVESRAYDLQKRGLLRHPTDQPGFILSQPAHAKRATPAQVRQPNGASTRNGSVASKSARPSPAKQAGNQLPLYQVLTNLLSKSRQPVAAKELASQVLASGYRTKSKDFIEVVWVGLGKMNNVENVPGAGWRLKQRKA